MPKLVLLSGTKVAAKFPLTGEKTTLGRDDDNDIVLEGSSVSRVHSQVVLEGENFFIEDLGSRNGTLLNNIRIIKEQLRDGDELAIGEYTFLFEEDVIAEEEKGETIISSFSDFLDDDTQKRAQQNINAEETGKTSTPDTRTDLINDEPPAERDDDATIIEDVASITGTEITPAKLLVLKNNKILVEHLIKTDIVTIGSDAGNILRIDDPSIANFHLQVVKEGQNYKVVDLESPQGTILRGVNIAQSTLRNGDELEVGKLIVLFRDVKEIPVTQQPVPVPQSPSPVPVSDDRTDPAIETYDDDRTIIQSELSGEPPAMIHHPKLVMLEGPLRGQEFVLNKKQNRIGRDNSADIVIKDESISRLHAIISVDQDIVSITDQESLNGVEIDGEVISEAVLRRGDQFRLGTILFRFVDRGEVYSIDALLDESTGVSSIRESTSAKIKEDSTPRKMTPLRMGLIAGIAFMMFLLVLSFFLKDSTPPPTLSTVGPSDSVSSLQKPTRAVVSEISIYQLLTEGKDDLDYHKWEDAIVQFNKVLEVRPEHEEARILREQAQTEMQNYELLNLGKRRLAASQLEDALRIFQQIPPSSVYHTSGLDQMEIAKNQLIQRHLKDGNKYRDQKLYAQALEEYNKALQYDSVNAKILKEKSDIEAKLHGGSTADTQESPATTASTRPSRNNRQNAAQLVKDGLNDYVNGDSTAAISKFQQVLKLGLSESDSNVNKSVQYIRLVSQIKDYFESGQNYFNQGDVDRAYDEWKKVIELDKQVPKSRNSTYYNKIALPMAEKLYEKGERIYQQNRNSYQLSEAYASFEKALQFNPNHQMAKSGLEKINEIASNVYREGYVRQDSDVNYALSKWKLVLQIVPESNEYNDKASKMIQKYDR